MRKKLALIPLLLVLLITGCKKEETPGPIFEPTKPDAKTLILGNWTMYKSQISFETGGKITYMNPITPGSKLHFTVDTLKVDDGSFGITNYPYLVVSKNGIDSLILKNRNLPESSGMLINNTEITAINDTLLELTGSYQNLDPNTNETITFVNVRSCRRIK